jgi:hypothetical protein
MQNPVHVFSVECIITGIVLKNIFFQSLLYYGILRNHVLDAIDSIRCLRYIKVFQILIPLFKLIWLSYMRTRSQKIFKQL